ncbi:hypothetical protein CDL12_15351 [Handroanthus impetiginosus]|uniref:Uncharacterized protein n=1 Tax=Handroanthus impetiginosus TaxID=429701 RepID=A0A2G9H3F8_9LAMI|nr:hypothetical protein CDL12_15351 [Handroanthus impetiginosus]
MATSSCTCFTPLLNTSLTTSTHKNGAQICSLFPSSTNFQPLRKAARTTNCKGSKNFVRNATPEAAGDVLSSFSLPSIPGFSLPGDHPWIAGIVGLLLTVPFIVQRVLTLTKEVDMAAETVEKIADTVEKVAEEVDKAAEEIEEALPEGGLKKVVNFVEGLAEETAKDAQKVEDLMDKVEEIDDKVDTLLKKPSSETEKA